MTSELFLDEITMYIALRNFEGKDISFLLLVLAYVHLHQTVSHQIVSAGLLSNYLIKRMLYQADSEQSNLKFIG